MSIITELSRTNRRLRTRKTNTVTLCLIFLLGVILGHFSARLQTLSRDDDDDNKEEWMSLSWLSSTTKAKTTASTDSVPSSDRENGWDVIHVFYGSKETFEGSLPKDLEWFSQAGQDEIVMSLLRNKTHGYFVDLAANDATHLSNTYVLETKYQWTGLCIEPNPQYWENLTYRTNCHVVGAVVGRQRMEEVHFRFDAGVYGGIAGSGFDNGPKFKSQSERRYTVTLHEILTRFQAPTHIDYLSLDVEGAEEFIMKEFPFDTFHISIMSTERPSESLRQVLAENGFRNLVRLTRWGEIMWVHESVWDSLDMSILDRMDEIKAAYAQRYASS